LLVAVGIGLSRVYLGGHYPLDVGAGALLGVLGGLAARLLVS
jgi:undecaprenyl-diphosphatase